MSTESTMTCDGCGIRIGQSHIISLREEGIAREKGRYFPGTDSNPFRSLDFCNPVCLVKWLKEYVKD
jgi:hypothetical protein